MDRTKKGQRRGRGEDDLRHMKAQPFVVHVFATSVGYGKAEH